MSRAPFNVLVFPYRSTRKGRFVYALLKRRDRGFWHTVAGGGEGTETPIEAARRETFEETGIPADARFLPLDTVMPVPVTEYLDSPLWGKHLYVIPQYAFGVRTRRASLALSDEHVACRWFDYEEARGLVEYEGSRIALWELDRRVRGLGPRDEPKTRRG